MTDASTKPTPVIIVTGLSGAGKTVVLKAFEDIGYETVDNLPVNLLPRLLREEESLEPARTVRPIAIGIDCRTRAFNADDLIDAVKDRIDLAAIRFEVLFLDCDDEVLERRFSETRRRHPLAQSEPVHVGIVKERMMMMPLRREADTVLNTSAMTGHETRAWVSDRYALDTTPQLVISLVSFSYAKGLPREADMVFDVRFLRNPHYDPALRPKTGKDKRVATYVREDPDFAPFAAEVEKLLALILPRIRREGKSYLTIGFGCTGGRHRSVTLAEYFGKLLGEQGHTVTVAHRDARGLL